MPERMVYYFTDKLKEFNYVKTSSLEEAINILSDYGKKAKILAGGTNLIPALRWRILPQYPEILADIKPVKELKYIQRKDGAIHIGSLTTLEELLELKELYGDLKLVAEAAKMTAPQLRTRATIGGDLCQELYSWYHWNPNPSIHDLPADYIATEGMNQYLSIFGGEGVNYAVNISHIALALTALKASVITTEREIPISEFYTDKFMHTSNTVLKPGEIIKEIKIPASVKQLKWVFQYVTIRKANDVPLASIAITLKTSGDVIEDVNIVLGAVAPRPIKALASEEFLKGKELSKELIEKAANKAIEGSKPLSRNKYKLTLINVLVLRALKSLAQ